VSDYLPLDCSLHDRLEAFATRRQLVHIRWQDESGEHDAEDFIVDIRARGGAEFLVTAGRQEIRLDRLLEVGGIEFRRWC